MAVIQNVGQRNSFRPSGTILDPLGWSSVPDGLVTAAYGNGVTGGAIAGAGQAIGNGSYDPIDADSIITANPPFLTGAAGRLNPAIHNGGAERIQRGYIRRAQVSDGDPLSKARLYFMFNPDTVTRNYVAYLDQQALDPFNTIYGAGNLVAAPGFMDFTFTLFFDRQQEVASIKDHRGVYVDYEYFDIVVRNTPPQDANSGGGTSVQDSGVLFINPRDITVVFSQELTVQGRATNATVNFTKFSNRMVPVRMEIQIQMKVLYIGPQRPQTEAVDFNQELSYAITVPYDSKLGLPVTNNDVSFFRATELNSVQSGGSSTTDIDLSGSVLTDRQLLSLVMEVGVPKDQWAIAIAIALAESSGQVSAIGGPNSDGTYDRGLWQVNDIHPQYDRQQLISSPIYNARAMYDISSGGTVWRPWSSYDPPPPTNNSSYQQFLVRAQEAVQAGPEPLIDSSFDVFAKNAAGTATGNSDAIAGVLEYAHTFAGLRYVYGGDSLISGCDCSGFVYALFRERGLLTAMNWAGRQNVDSMMRGWLSRNWDSATPILNWDPSSNKASIQQQLFNTMRPGDFVIRWGHSRSDHMGFFDHWVGDNPVMWDQADPPGYVGERNLEATYFNWVADACNWVVRPQPVGSLTIGRS